MKARDEITQPKPTTGHFENPADADAMKAVTAAREAGEDPFGDEDGFTAAPEAEEAQADAPVVVDDDHGEPDAPADDEQTPAESLEAEAAQPADEPEAPAAPVAPTPHVQYKTRTAKELAEAQAAVLTARTEAFKQYSDGTMSADDYAKADMEAMQTLMTLAREGALQEATTQTAIQQSEKALMEVKAQAKLQGLDYDKDTKAALQFDQASEVLAKDPDMAKLPDAEFFAKVNEMVFFMRGVKPAAAPAPAPNLPPARADMKAPITLRGMPAAATPNTGGGLGETLGRLNGLDFQDAVGALPKEQRNQWLDS
jgi:hypothetical protein